MRWLAALIQRWSIAWGVATVLVYLAAIPLTIYFFPRNTLTLTVVVLFGGFTSSMFALASAIVVAEDKKAEAEAEARR